MRRSRVRFPEAAPYVPVIHRGSRRSHHGNDFQAPFSTVTARYQPSSAVTAALSLWARRPPLCMRLSSRSRSSQIRPEQESHGQDQASPTGAKRARSWRSTRRRQLSSRYSAARSLRGLRGRCGFTAGKGPVPLHKRRSCANAVTWRDRCEDDPSVAVDHDTGRAAFRRCELRVFFECLERHGLPCYPRGAGVAGQWWITSASSWSVKPSSPRACRPRRNHLAGARSRRAGWPR